MGVDLILEVLFEGVEFRFQLRADDAVFGQRRGDDAVHAGEEFRAVCVVGGFHLCERRFGVDGALQALLEQGQRTAVLGHLLHPCVERVDLGFGGVCTAFDAGLELAVGREECLIGALQQVVVEHSYNVCLGSVDVTLDRLALGEPGAESLQYRDSLGVGLKRLVGCLRESIVFRLIHLAGDLGLHRFDLALDGVDRFVAGRDLSVQRGDLAGELGIQCGQFLVDDRLGVIVGCQIVGDLLDFGFEVGVVTFDFRTQGVQVAGELGDVCFVGALQRSDRRFERTLGCRQIRSLLLQGGF